MATKPFNTSAFLAKLLAPLPAGEMPADTDAYRRQMADDAKAASDIFDIVDHMEHLRRQAANPDLNDIQRHMCAFALEFQEASYANLRRPV